MNTFHVLSGWNQPKLWVWRDKPANGSGQLEYDAEFVGVGAHGLHRFQTRLDHQVHEPAHALLHAEKWESNDHTKDLPRTAQYRFPADFWMAHGSNRVVTQDPFSAACDRVRIHLVTASRYRNGKLFIWSPGRIDRWIEAVGTDGCGPFFDVALEGRDQHLFQFKFLSATGEPEPDYANRLWTAHDGREIWVHSHATAIGTTAPQKKPLVVHYLPTEPSGSWQLHLWQEDSDFITDVASAEETGGWLRFETTVYTRRPYRFLAWREDGVPVWEDTEATRTAFVTEAGDVGTTDGDGQTRNVGAAGAWTIEGDHELFGAPPVPDRQVEVSIAGRTPESEVLDNLVLDVWINRARTALLTGLTPDGSGVWHFTTYPGVVTSFRFRSATGAEKVDRHPLKIRANESRLVRRYIVLGRADPLVHPPVPDLFQDPPFQIRRPGTWVEDGEVRFALHAPAASAVELIADWTDWEASPVPLRSTRDGAYWWTHVPVSKIAGYNARGSIDGALYKFVLNQVRLVQDPAADWVESSDPEKASKLVDHASFPWTCNAWRRPGWEYLTLYQLHPSRFSARAGLTGLPAVTRELTEGYLQQVNATAILLMPINEFAGTSSWGYNPSFFYSVESSYGGPRALKELVDACHAKGWAVLLDVVFNHAGTSDNVLWSVAPDSYFKGDTVWGKMINFEHPQVIHFFEQNLVHFMTRYRVDGFRFDFTRLIRYGGTWTDHVREPGSSGGWEFMKRLRAAVRAVDPRCLMMAEHYPNESDVTDVSGPMDTQWCDDFHDRLVDASRGWDVMSPLADALKTTHRQGGGWQTATNFPESHDEVGNEPNRIVHVAGPGQGYRRNKVAAAATLFSRGIPLWFMGAESGEWRQFRFGGKEALDLGEYEADASAITLRKWWNRLCQFRRGNSRVQGPAPLRVHYAQNRMLAFSRGEADDVFVVLNFGDWTGQRSLGELNLPDGVYREALNSSWNEYRLPSEDEDEVSNGRGALALNRGATLNIPDYGVVVLERT